MRWHGYNTFLRRHTRRNFASCVPHSKPIGGILTVTGGSCGRQSSRKAWKPGAGRGLAAASAPRTSNIRRRTGFDALCASNTRSEMMLRHRGLATILLRFRLHRSLETCVRQPRGYPYYSSSAPTKPKPKKASSEPIPTLSSLYAVPECLGQVHTSVHTSVYTNLGNAGGKHARRESRVEVRLKHQHKYGVISSASCSYSALRHSSCSNPNPLATQGGSSQGARNGRCITEALSLCQV